jgi:hypothetical protein
MGDSDKLEAQLSTGHEVRLTRRDAHDILQKLRARGAGSQSANRLEAQLAHHPEEVVLGPDEAAAVLEELRASGRRWVFGSDAPRQRPIPRAPEPERRPEPEPERPRRLRKLWHR